MRATATGPVGRVHCFVVCSALILGLSGPAEAKSAADWTADHAYETVEREVGIVFPGASFAQCEQSEHPERCKANKADLVRAFKVLDKIRFMYFGFKRSLSSADFIRFLEKDFLELSLELLS